jgi:hypothetical protein
MLLLTAAVVAALPPASDRHVSAGASVQATATVRVIYGARLDFRGRHNDPDVPHPRDTMIHTADSGKQPARLFEFE